MTQKTEQYVEKYSSESVQIEYHKDSTVVKLLPGHNYTIMIPGAKPIQVEVPKPK